MIISSLQDKKTKLFGRTGRIGGWMGEYHALTALGTGLVKDERKDGFYLPQKDNLLDGTRT
ncbi:MAG: hypothetical protein KDD01_10445, partial [Phaeodactylibacter sp.]|nr:hypothetical protein [Phaeodactylibacter sp.]